MRKEKLSKYIQGSDLMNISITYGTEKLKFNMFEELQINENTINSQIKEQPSVYAYIGMLHKKLLRASSEQEKKAERAFAKAYIRIKAEIDPTTNRVHADKLAKEKAEVDIRYKKSYSEYLGMKEQAETIGICLKSFEQRSNLIQTIAANLRKER